MPELEPQGINKNRTIEDLDELDKEFCKTFDRLIDLHRRIMIVAHKLQERNEKLHSDFLAQSSDIREGLRHMT